MSATCGSRARPPAPTCSASSGTSPTWRSATSDRRSARRHDPDHPLFGSDPDYDADPQADWWVPASVPATEVVDFYRSVWAFSDATVADLPLDAAGAAPWWSAAHRDVTLHRVLVHVLADLTRHAGHADILREDIDGAAGLTVAASPTCPRSTGRRTSPG